jgi:hypothetical protein
MPDWLVTTTIGRRSLFAQNRAVENARDELELVRTMDVAAIHVDHAIAVEKRALPGMCSTVFIRFS